MRRCRVQPTWILAAKCCFDSFGNQRAAQFNGDVEYPLARIAELAHCRFAVPALCGNLGPGYLGERRELLRGAGLRPQFGYDEGKFAIELFGVNLDSGFLYR